MKIVIFGAGIGGLTVAHQIIRNNPGAEITIYEKRDVVGGMARSSYNNGYPTEYCWRVVFGFYENMFNILKEIPNTAPLTPYKHINIYDTPTKFSDKLKVYKSVLGGVTSCDERLNDYDNLTWWNAIGTTSQSNIYREIGGWLGMDRYNGSYNSVIRVGMEQNIIQSIINPCYKDYVFTKPTSDAWFDPWVIDLKSRGVKFQFGESLQAIDKDRAIVSNKVVTADKFVLAVPVDVLAKLGLVESANELVAKSMHMQLSFQVFFNQEISLGEKNAFLLIDSPWDLIVLSYDSIYPNKTFKGGWSIAVTTAYIDGIVFGKPFEKCSYEEIIKEIYAQLTNSKKLQELISKNNNGVTLNSNIIVHWAPMWPSFSYKNGRLTTDEPKFTNNAGSLKLRPSFKLGKNLYLATAYIKETIDIYSMEGACIAGKYVAADILNNVKLAPTMPRRPIIFAPFRMIDKVCYCLNLPNLSIFVIFLLIVIILYVKR